MSQQSGGRTAHPHSVSGFPSLPLTFSSVSIRMFFTRSRHQFVQSVVP